MSEVNNLPFIDPKNSETGCCPKFSPEPWDEKTIVLDDMLFAKASTKSLFYMPLNLGKVFTNVQKAIDRSHANLESGYLTLSQDVSKWKADHYFHVSKEVPELEMVRMSGTFMTKVFNANFKQFPELIKKLETFIQSKGYEMKEFFVFYTTCPKCAKHYGHNYMVFFGRIS